MKRALFTPFSVISGLVAGIVAEKIFERIWAKVDNEPEAPSPKHRDIRWRKLLAALAVQGAIMRLVRGSVDRGSRVAFNRVTGSWPGEPKPS
ncbi:MAG TPA: DUF4235 domain-containing protein [Solirubrobacterales bacterium]|nr:DUF4235 domain-containing protein [Solirubrobacterales bacterium]